MPVDRYLFHSTWRVRAPSEAAWRVITDLIRYPAWWREFESVKRLNDIEGVGARASAVVKSALPYRIRFEMEATIFEERRVSEVRCAGDIIGVIRWELDPDGEGTALRFLEDVRLGKSFLNLLAPIARPFFQWNHEIMMRHGQKGLRRQLKRLQQWQRTQKPELSP